METEAVVALICTRDSFRPVEHAAVRWLDPEADLPLFQQTARELGGEPPSREDLDEWREQGYRYCALVQGERIIAKAAVWSCSETAWELAAVFTLPEHRGRGYAQAVCSFATAQILATGRTATCHTAATNTPMLRTAESLGYRRSGVGE